VAVDELSNKVHHQIRLHAALCFALFCLGVSAGSPLGQDPLSLNPGLERRDRSIFADRVLARVPPIACGAVLDEKRPPTGRSDLQAETFEVLIPPNSVALSGAGEGVNGAL
jgi:hypothetical protein